ncbi:hypothetical protein QQP08_006817 [Theobroma cacao]|nr:hypothetical protein QQP08_006817 [Theobroma cacao]
MTEFSSQYHFATITIFGIPICCKSMESMTSSRSSKYFLCFINSDMIVASSPEHVARSAFSLSRCAMFSCSFSSFLSLETFIQMTISNILATSSGLFKFFIIVVFPTPTVPKIPIPFSLSLLSNSRISCNDLRRPRMSSTSRKRSSATWVGNFVMLGQSFKKRALSLVNVDTDNGSDAIPVLYKSKTISFCMFWKNDCGIVAKLGFLCSNRDKSSSQFGLSESLSFSLKELATVLITSGSRSHSSATSRATGSTSGRSIFSAAVC